MVTRGRTSACFNDIDPQVIPDAEDIQRQMSQILTSPEFDASETQITFLKFIVETVLAGRSHEIKGYTVATQVFGRGENFDQATDPIVSIQANKLRRALERYYLIAGQNDPLRIDIPKGSYVPVFNWQNSSQQNAADKDGSNKRGVVGSWPTILVRPFLNLTGEEKLDYLGIGLATDLATEVTRYQEIRVLLAQHQGGELRRVADTSARFVVDGSIQRCAAGLKVNVSLVDTSTGLLIWGDSYKSDCAAADLVDFQEEVANKVAGKLSSEYGIVATTLERESKQHPPAESSTYEAMLRYYQFNAHFSAETFYAALETLQHASRREPECGLVWSMLARLYTVNYSLELFPQNTPLESAVSFAERGVQFEPDVQRTRIILAYVRLFQNEISAGVDEVDRGLAINPNSLVFLENIGYLLTLFGDWQRGPALIREAISANPYYNRIVHHTLWLDWIRQEDYPKAYQETLNFRTPLLFWEPLIKASTLGLLGRTEEAAQAGQLLLQYKPDFIDRGRTLIKRYIKFDDLVEKVLQGLRQADIKLA